MSNQNTELGMLTPEELDHVSAGATPLNNINNPQPGGDNGNPTSGGGNPTSGNGNPTSG